MDLKKYIPYAIGLIVIYIIYKQFTGAKAKVKLVDNLDIFSYQKWIDTKAKFPKAQQLSSPEIIALVDRIYNAKGYFNDDEQAIYGVFRAMKTQSQISALAKRFNQLKAQDLYSYLKNYLNEEELLTVKKIIDQKPKYFA
jgi:acyl-CoA-binding protein